MSAKKKPLLVIIFLFIIFVIINILYGLFLMADEDKYGDLVYIGEKVKDGDIILKCTKEYLSNEKSDFDQIGTIEKSFWKVYVWDNKTNLKKTLFDWAEKQNAQKVIVVRAKRKTNKKNIPKVEGKFNYLLKSDEYELITETL